MEQAVALVSLTDGLIIVHCIISRYCLCFVTKSGRFAYTTDRASTARQNGSQLDADALRPNTIAVARLKYPPALKPKAPVRSACICGKQKQVLMSAVPRRIGLSGKEIFVSYTSVRNCNYVVPKVMGASLSTGVTWFITMSVERRVVDAS